MPRHEQVAAIGAANYKLLRDGQAEWHDIVTPMRVRDLREVVAIKKLSVQDMLDAGIKPQIAERAHASVHTPEHELIEQHRRELMDKVRQAGLSQDELTRQIAMRLGERVTVAAGPIATGTTELAWQASKIGGQPHAAELAAILRHWPKPPPKKKPKEPPPEPPAGPTTSPEPPSTPTPPEGMPTRPEPRPIPDEPVSAPTPPRPPQAPPPAPAPPVAPKKPKPPGMPKNPATLTVVRSIGGSTGAELVKDNDGRLFVRKKGSSPGHLREEGIADELYRKLGVDVPKSKIYETANGPVKLAEYHEGVTLGELQRALPPGDLPGWRLNAALIDLRKHFVADALLGNWDVIGTGADNILVTPNGTPLRIDNGGSLRYRARGALKGETQWTGRVGELWSMRDPARNADAAKIFGSLTDEEIKKQIKRILPKEPAVLRAAPAEIRETLKERFEHLRSYAAEKPKPPIVPTGVPLYKKEPLPYANHLKDVARDREGQIRDRADRARVDVQTARATIENKIKAVIEEGDFYVRVTSGVLPTILEEGRFKSQFETNSSNGMMNKSHRSKIEERTIGVPATTKPADRPIYGYASAKNFQSFGAAAERDLSSYGGIAIKLKDHVRNRATVTFGDSLNENAYLAATRATDVSLESIAKIPFTVSDKSTDELRQEIQHRQSYIEAQYHGQLTVGDIAEIGFRYAPSPPLVRSLQAKGIPWRQFGDQHD